MEGYQYRQQVQYDTVTASANRAGFFLYDLGTPYDLNTRFSAVTPGSDEKVSLRQQSNSILITNACNSPIVIKMYKARCRKNCVTSIQTLLIDNAPDIATPNIDITTSVAFRRYFKIFRGKTMTLYPGRVKEVKLKSFYKSPKMISGDIEANNSYQYTTLTQVLFAQFFGAPYAGLQTDLTSSAPVKLNFISQHKIVYTLIEDNDPSSIAYYGPNQSDSTGYAVFSDAFRQTYGTDVSAPGLTAPMT